MSSLEMPPMEGGIQEEEVITSPKTGASPKKLPKVNINLLALKAKVVSIVKTTKLKTVFILFIVFIVVSAGLIIISSRKSSNSDLPPGITVATPQPQQVVSNPQNKEIEDKLNEYDKKVDALGNNQNSYQPPQIDLNVNF